MVYRTPVRISVCKLGGTTGQNFPPKLYHSLPALLITRIREVLLLNSGEHLDLAYLISFTRAYFICVKNSNLQLSMCREKYVLMQLPSLL